MFGHENWDAMIDHSIPNQGVCQVFVTYWKWFCFWGLEGHLPQTKTGIFPTVKQQQQSQPTTTNHSNHDHHNHKTTKKPPSNLLSYQAWLPLLPSRSNTSQISPPWRACLSAIWELQILCHSDAIQMLERCWMGKGFGDSCCCSCFFCCLASEFCFVSCHFMVYQKKVCTWVEVAKYWGQKHIWWCVCFVGAILNTWYIYNIH